MKKLLFIFLIILNLIQNNVAAQQNEESSETNRTIDSLLAILNVTNDDTTKVNTLNNLFLQYEYVDDVKAKEYLNNAIKISKKIDYKKGLAASFVYLGFLAKDQGNYPEALKNYFISMEIYKSADDKKNMAVSYNNIGIVYRIQGNYHDALNSYIKSLKIFEAIGNKRAIANLYNNIGNVYWNFGNYQEALKNQLAALKIRKEMGDKIGIGQSYQNIGNVFYNIGNYQEALKNYLASLYISEEIKDKKGIADTYISIGSLYNALGNFPKALKNYNAALKIMKELGAKDGVAASYSGIGLVYYLQGNYTESLKNHFASLKIQKAIGDRNGVANSYNNIGLAYFNQAKEEQNEGLRKSKFEQSLKNYSASLEIDQVIDDNAGIAASYCNIGNVFLIKKQYKEARENLIKAEELSKKIGHKEFLRNTYKALTDLDSACGNYKGAYENHKLYILYRDSLDNEETRKKTIQSQMTYDFEKKELATKAEQEKKDAIATADKKRQKLFLLFIALLAVAIAIIAAVIFRGLQQSKKAKRLIELQRDEITEQKEVVEHQKLLVEEHQKEIVDSITYAKRIQYTLLANKKLLEKNLPEHFVLFKPKDIVSGDFYWATEKSWQSTINKEEKIKRFYIAACDSTGHGVPGAFMSLLNISFLNEAVNEKNIVEPHEILDHVRKRLIENMDGGQDGMDCILVCFETGFLSERSPLSFGEGLGVRCTYAAANNSPTIIKNGQLISLDTDKMPVGKGERTAAFTLRTIELEKGDSLYLYTDGYADQFGGPKGKKFKYKQLDELLVSITNLPPNEQSEILNQRFEDWKGNLEQVDDMLVIGITM